MKIPYRSFCIDAGSQSRQGLLLQAQVQCRLHISSSDEDIGNSAAKTGSCALHFFLHQTMRFLLRTRFIVSNDNFHFLEKRRLRDIASDEIRLQRIYHPQVPYPAHIVGLNHLPEAWLWRRSLVHLGRS